MKITKFIIIFITVALFSCSTSKEEDKKNTPFELKTDQNQQVKSAYPNIKNIRSTRSNKRLMYEIKLPLSNIFELRKSDISYLMKSFVAKNIEYKDFESTFVLVRADGYRKILARLSYEKSSNNLQISNEYWDIYLNSIKTINNKKEYFLKKAKYRRDNTIKLYKRFIKDYISKRNINKHIKSSKLITKNCYSFRNKPSEIGLSENEAILLELIFPEKVGINWDFSGIVLSNIEISNGGVDLNYLKKDFNKLLKTPLRWE
ncbi:MAG: hypothetical protein GY714_18490 [Desulfobacterales bacterium]|nr:hypothetical protein [Desulfobacterales bacterium]